MSTYRCRVYLQVAVAAVRVDFIAVFQGLGVASVSDNPGNGDGCDWGGGRGGVDDGFVGRGSDGHGAVAEWRGSGLVVPLVVEREGVVGVVVELRTRDSHNRQDHHLNTEKPITNTYNSLFYTSLFKYIILF